MARIYLLFAFFAIRNSNSINISILSFDLLGEDGHPVLQLFSINGIIFREIQIHKASDCMPISSIPDIPIFIMISVDYLLVEPCLVLFWIHLGTRGHCRLILNPIGNTVLLFSMKLINIINMFLLFLFFILILACTDLFTIGFCKLVILFHCLVHVAIVDVHIHHLFAFLEGLIFLF